MPAEDEIAILLERARVAREIAAQISDRAAANGLLRYAEEYEAKASALEAQTTLPLAATIPSGEPSIARAGAALKPLSGPEAELSEDNSESKPDIPSK